MSQWTGPMSSSVAEDTHAVHTKTSVCVVDGPHMFRSALCALLNERGVDVCQVMPTAQALTEALEEAKEPLCDAIVLLLSGGPFSTFHHIREALESTEHRIPLLVLSERATRGQVYAALRIGAKAYVSFEAEPDELIKAISMAAQNKVYLAPDAAELLVSDVSTAVDPGSSTGRLPSLELSRREIEIVQLLCEGLTSKEIGRRLHISGKTVENHRYNIYRKCEVDSLAGLMRHAIQHGLVTI